jgi:dTDP-4-dehydrorhamnose reductase
VFQDFFRSSKTEGPLRIAVLGSSGMLGSKVAALFRRFGHEVFAPDWAEWDLTRTGDFGGFFADHEFEGLINCAAFTDVDACEDPSVYPKALAINGAGPGCLASECRKSGRWMVHLSTDYVFDGSADRPYAEAEPVRPINAYGRTKAEGERGFLESGTEGYLVRTSWLYGPNGRNFVKTMAGLLRTRPSVEVVDDQLGGPTYTGDLAAFLLDLVETRPPMGIYHFANEGVVSWRGFAEAVRDGLHVACEVLPVTSEKFSRPAKRPRNSCFDLTKARGVSRKPLRPWREALADYLKEERL